MKIIRYLHHFIKVYNAFRKRLTRWWDDMATKKMPKKKPKVPRRRRVTFYIYPKGSNRRKKVSFLVRR